MTDYLSLAKATYRYAEDQYGTKGARFDVIVECMTVEEIADELRDAGASTMLAAAAWANEMAGLHFEQELNEAWDGPESVRSSPHYDPSRDPAA